MRIFGTRLMYDAFIRYGCPNSGKVVWNIGVLCFYFLCVQLCTGIVLTSYYASRPDIAFASIEILMREVGGGWIVRALHSTGASFFFIFIFVHIIRGLWYGAARWPRMYVWYSGIVAYLCLILIAFCGYILPWGQMSYWAVTVITNMLVRFPVYGDVLVRWCLGGHVVGAATLGRLYTIHTILPFVLFCIGCIHMYLLHYSGSSIEIGVSATWLRTIARAVPFTPYYIIKDTLVLLCITCIYVFISCVLEYVLQLPINHQVVQLLRTPEHILPEWYFLILYAFIRDSESLLYGILSVLLYLLVMFYIENIIDFGYPIMDILNKCQTNSLIRVVYAFYLAMLFCLFDMCGVIIMYVVYTHEAAFTTQRPYATDALYVASDSTLTSVAREAIRERAPLDLANMCVLQIFGLPGPQIFVDPWYASRYIASVFLFETLNYVVCGTTDVSIDMRLQYDMLMLIVGCVGYCVRQTKQSVFP